MDLRETFKKLQSIDAKDLKSLEFSQIVEYLVSKPIVIISAVLVLITLITTSQTLRINSGKKAVLDKELASLKEKSAAVDKFKAIKSEYDNFLASFPKEISMTELTDKITEFATVNNIQIEKFAPLAVTEGKFLELSGLQFNISSDRYANFVNFMSEMEKAPFAIRLIRWTGQLKATDDAKGRRGYQKPLENENVILANIEISNFILKNEKAKKAR